MDIGVHLLQGFRTWDQVLNLICDQKKIYYHSDRRKRHQQFQLKKILVASTNKNTMGLSLIRKRFGAMILAISDHSWAMKLNLVGSILLEINGEIVLLEEFQSLATRSSCAFNIQRKDCEIFS
jgi:hypothetical protein